MHIREFFDISLLEGILNDWSVACGMATAAVDTEGNYLTGLIGFNEFCIKYTRGSKEGLKRCLKCDMEGKGTYACHAGLMDFCIDIIVNGTVLGKIIGGQVLPKEPDEEEFRRLAGELGIDPNQYIKSLRKVPIRSEKGIHASANLLGKIVNMLVNFEYVKYLEGPMLETMNREIGTSSVLIQEINNKSKDLDSIQGKQRILALNASIEAARAGDLAKGFAVVATEVGKLAEDSAKVNYAIKQSVKDLTGSIDLLDKARSQQREDSKE